MKEGNGAMADINNDQVGSIPKFCPNCGTKTTGTRFCGNCGTKFF
jgi:ribosomal protein S27AE